MHKTIKEYYRYLPISEQDSQWGIYVKAGGYQIIEPGGKFPRPGHPRGYAFSWNKGRIFQEYAAIYIPRGEGQFESKPSGTLPVSAGSVILLFPGVWHRYRPESKVGWDEYWIVFNGRNIESLVEYGFFSPENPVLKTGSDDLLMHAYNIFLDRLRSEPVGVSQFLAASAMEILAATLGAVRAQGTGGRMHQLVCQAKSILECQVETVPTMEMLARSIGLSVAHFHRIFKEHTGLSPYQYHLQLRIERAKQMLHGTTLNVKQIAAALIFESPYHFSKVFKLKTGMSPSQWRQRG